MRERVERSGLQRAQVLARPCVPQLRAAVTADGDDAVLADDRGGLDLLSVALEGLNASPVLGVPDGQVADLVRLEHAAQLGFTRQPERGLSIPTDGARLQAPRALTGRQTPEEDAPAPVRGDVTPVGPQHRRPERISVGFARIEPLGITAPHRSV